MKETLGARVAKKRQENCMTQKELAEAVKRYNPEFRGGQSTIQALESGQSKKTTILYELARALNTTEQYLVTGVNPGGQSSTVSVNTTIEQFAAAVHGSYLMLGLSEDEASALLDIVTEVAEEPPIPGVPENGHEGRKLLAASLTRRFLKTRIV